MERIWWARIRPTWHPKNNRNLSAPSVHTHETQTEQLAGVSRPSEGVKCGDKQEAAAQNGDATRVSGSLAASGKNGARRAALLTRQRRKGQPVAEAGRPDAEG